MWIDRYYYKLHHPEMPDRDIVSVSICPEGVYKVGDIVQRGDWAKEIVKVVPRIREANEHLTAKWEDALRDDLHIVRPLTKKEVELLEDEPVMIWHKEHGRWKDIAKGVSSFMDMNDMELASGKWLGMETYGDAWVCYKQT